MFVREQNKNQFKLFKFEKLCKVSNFSESKNKPVIILFVLISLYNFIVLIFIRERNKIQFKLFEFEKIR